MRKEIAAGLLAIALVCSDDAPGSAGEVAGGNAPVAHFLAFAPAEEYDDREDDGAWEQGEPLTEEREYIEEREELAAPAPAAETADAHGRASAGAVAGRDAFAPADRLPDAPSVPRATPSWDLMPMEQAPVTIPEGQWLTLSAKEDAEDEKKHAVEVQVEYLQARFFNNRSVNRWNASVFEKVKENGSVSMYRGITLSKMTGDVKHNGHWRDSDAWGIGPTFMIRWEKRLTGKLYGALEGSGTIQVYSKAHPYGGRAFGFLWRVGPRLTYRYTDHENLSLAYIFHHTSNGMPSHNPGYNGIGFSMGYQHSF